MQAGNYKSMFEVVGNVMKSEGIRGMYTGYGITIMREIPFALIQFPMYEKMMVCSYLFVSKLF